jgi:formylglycine-generating enzyme required for sulfatase activity
MQEPIHRFILKNGNEEEHAGDEKDLLSFLTRMVADCVKHATARRKGTRVEPLLVFVRGRMGSGCSTICERLRRKLRPEPRTGGEGYRVGEMTLQDQQEHVPAGTYELLDADSAMDPKTIGEQISERIERQTPITIVFGREDSLRLTGLFHRADWFCDLVPVEAGSNAAMEWIEYFSKQHTVTKVTEHRPHVAQIFRGVARRREYQGVRWIDLIVRWVSRRLETGNSLSYSSPLLLFCEAIGYEIAPTALAEIEERLKREGLRTMPEHSFTVVQLLRAKLVLQKCFRFQDLAKERAPFEATEFLCAHLECLAEAQRLGADELWLLGQFLEFISIDMFKGKAEQQPAVSLAGGHGLYLQGMVAGCLQVVASRRFDDPAIQEKSEKWASAVIEFRNRMQKWIDDGNTSNLTPALLWDLTDTLHKVSLPRVTEAMRNHDKESYYREYAIGTAVHIGSAHEQRRVLAPSKPLLPYRWTQVPIHEAHEQFWVGKYLVTVKEYREFYAHCLESDRVARSYFDGDGLRWFDEDQVLLAKIKRDFGLTKERTLDCERQVTGAAREAVRDYEMRMLNRALHGQPKKAGPQGDKKRPKRVWERDEHHKGDFLPVVDVNWWEANAFCRWFTKVKLDPNQWTPDEYEARLMPDWMWEAIRRLAFNDHGDSTVPSSRPESFRAHVKSGRPENVLAGRVGHLCFPVHVGLFPPPASSPGEGPYDLAGNVWEWTSSASFAEVGLRDRGLLGFFRGLFGGRRAGHDGGFVSYFDDALERLKDPHDPDRERVSEQLQRRILRGGSFMADPPAYAWGACLRTCDPPYFSFQDVGFRVAIFRKSPSRKA